jgi:hypothetical protein
MSLAQWKAGVEEPVKKGGMGLKPCREMQTVSGRLRILAGAVLDLGERRGKGWRTKFCELSIDVSDAVEEEEDVYGRAFGWRDDIQDEVWGEILLPWKTWRRHPYSVI